MVKVSTKKVEKTKTKLVKTSNEKTKTKKNLSEKLMKKLGLKKERRGRPKKRKGFTLIELLAVIVILGLLMAIAIPSVTKYITQSRKKTLTTTMNNYMGSLVNEVNDSEYTLTESNTVYAVPIECIALERGGNNPFGEWLQANDKYFAYVLVQYDDENSTYNYGFTFKDSSGYGIYPTAQNKLDLTEKSIRTGLDLTRPKNGKITTLTSFDNWSQSGFNLNTNTEMVVLQAESEGKLGDGITTCTLQQKGKNYAQVEDEKKSQNNDQPPLVDEWKGDAYALVLDNSASASDKVPLIFVRSETPIRAGDTYNSDRYGNIKVTDAYTGFETTVYSGTRDFRSELGWDKYMYVFIGSVLNTPWSGYAPNITSVVAEDKVRFASLEGLFSGYPSIAYMDLGNIDVSQNTSLSNMFSEIGHEWSVEESQLGGGGFFEFIGGTSVEFKGLEKWDTSNIKDMSYMFYDARISSLGNISSWNTANVTDMSGMFMLVYGLDIDFSKWNVDKVESWENFIWDENVSLPDKFK